MKKTQSETQQGLDVFRERVCNETEHAKVSEKHSGLEQEDPQRNRQRNLGNRILDLLPLSVAKQNVKFVAITRGLYCCRGGNWGKRRESNSRMPVLTKIYHGR